MKAENSIDPTAPQYRDVPLWCVYGYDCFPEIIACTVHDHGQYSLCVWGYSVYRRQPGYRTLGRELQAWMSQYKMVEFFAKQEDAIMFINKLVTPKCDVNGNRL